MKLLKKNNNNLSYELNKNDIDNKCDINDVNNDIFSKKEQKIIKKMSRIDLLELLIIQRKTIDELEIKIASLNKLIEYREAKIKNIGTIAEASLVLNGVFEKAQEAANQYLENVKIVAKEIKSD